MTEQQSFPSAKTITEQDLMEPSHNRLLPAFCLKSFKNNLSEKVENVEKKENNQTSQNNYSFVLNKIKDD